MGVMQKAKPFGTADIGVLMGSDPGTKQTVEAFGSMAAPPETVQNRAQGFPYLPEEFSEESLGLLQAGSPQAGIRSGCLEKTFWESRDCCMWWRDER